MRDDFGQFTREDVVAAEFALVVLDRFLTGADPFGAFVIPDAAERHMQSRLGVPDPEHIRGLIQRLAEVEADAWQDGETVAAAANARLFGPGAEYEPFTAFVDDWPTLETEESLSPEEQEALLMALFGYVPDFVEDNEPDDWGELS